MKELDFTSLSYGQAYESNIRPMNDYLWIVAGQKKNISLQGWLISDNLIVM